MTYLLVGLIFNYHAFIHIGPKCQAVYAFTLSWEQLKFYAFPPFSCIPRTMQKIYNDKATGILIVPDWPNQPWYDQYKEMTFKEITLFSRPDLLLLPQNKTTMHPMHKKLQLKAAIVSGKQ